jgi:hypothetical protein
VTRIVLEADVRTAVVRPVMAVAMENESDVRLAASNQHREQCQIALLVLLSLVQVATLANVAVTVVVLHGIAT